MRFSQLLAMHLGEANDAQLGASFDKVVAALRENGGKGVMALTLSMTLSGVGALEVVPKSKLTLPQPALDDVTIYVNEETGEYSSDNPEQLTMLRAAGNA